MKLTRRGSHSLVTLLLTYFVTKKELTLPHDAQADTIARGVCLLCVLKRKAGLHIRLLAEQVMVSGWEKVPEVNGLQLLHLDAISPRVGGRHLLHFLHVHVVPLCVAAYLLRPQEADEFGFGRVVEFLSVLKHTLKLLYIWRITLMMLSCCSSSVC